ncbi:MAG: DUF3597 domain-containing protein [Chthoniobacterales bacterium]
MGILSTIISKVFGGKNETVAPPASPSAPVAEVVETVVAEAAPVVPVDFDVAGYLDGLCGQSKEKLDWHVSIVDLMKLVGMDSSLAARKELAQELGYPSDTADSAKMNIWLHKQVMQQIAKHGGKLPDSLVA